MLPTLLGSSATRIPTAGRIRAGIKVLTRKAAENTQAREINDTGVAEGRTFDAIERAIAQAVPELKNPLTPKNVPHFTVRGADFPNPEIARQIMDLYAEDRGEGRRLYRFPVVSC
jgi:Recombination directionality factor-like